MNSTTFLLRQIHPSFIQAGRVTSQAFRPTPKDEKKLSVYDGDQISCEDAWEHYTDVLKLKSIGTQKLTIEECQRYGLTVIADPMTFKEHMLIDFSNFSEREIKKKAKSLRSFAEKRGWCYEV